MVEDKISRLLTAKEAARYLHVSLFTLNKIEKQGYIVPYRTPGGHRRYSLEMLNAYLETTRKFVRKNGNHQARTTVGDPQQG